MDDKLRSTIERIVRLSRQNPEFDSELRKELGITSSASSSLEDERMSQIYEYCIKQIMQQQATDFYKNFPIREIVPDLVEDFVRMESFRRQNKFGDFCLALYQQIEWMTNKLCTNKDLSNITDTMWGYPAYVEDPQDKQPIDVSKRLKNSNYSIAKLVLPASNKQPTSVKALTPLQNLYAMDKVRTVVYFVGYKAEMRNSDYTNYVAITNELADIYQCRNMNHRGNTPLPWEQERYDRILPMTSCYYFKFLGVLAQYVTYICEGYANLPALAKYARSISRKVVGPDGPKVIDVIKLSDKDTNKPRFK